MEVSNRGIPLKSSKVNMKEKVRSLRRRSSFCSCCKRPLYSSLQCDGKLSTSDSSRKFYIDNYHNESLSTEKILLLNAEQKCKCTEQVLCKTSDTHSNQDLPLDQVQYICGSPSNFTLETKNYQSSNNNDELQERNASKFTKCKIAKLDPSSKCNESGNCFVKTELEKIVDIVKRKFDEELERKKQISIICSVPGSNNHVPTFDQQCDSFSFSTHSIKTPFSHDIEDSISETCFKNDLRETESYLNETDSLSTLLDIDGNICFDECEEKELSCIRESTNQGIDVIEPKVLSCGQTIKICKRRAPIILPHCVHYKPHLCFHDHIELSKLCNLGKSEEIAKWGECSDLVDKILLHERSRSKIIADDQTQKSTKDEFTEETEKTEICFRDGTCLDNFDDVNRFEEIGNYGFAVLCRKLMRWTNCVTKTWRETKKYPHIVVHLPSFACPDDLRCRAEKTYQFLQNIQIGRLGWLENKTSQVLYVCPDNMNLDICLLLKLVSVARPDINLDNLWLIKPEKKNFMEKCSSGCENLYFAPATYRRVRYLTAGRQAFIVPGILSKKDVFVACELKIAILGPCLKFQNRLLSKKYAMDVLYQAKINQPPFIGVKNFKDLGRNLAIIILKYPIYKLWFIKINSGHYGYQTAIFQIDEKLYEKINQKMCNQEDLENVLVDLLPKKLQLKEDIYRNSTEFFNDLGIYGGLIQACPNQKYNVISMGLLNEHDTAKPLLITAADVIQCKKDIRTDIGYIIPQSKISKDILKNLADKVGKAILHEQYIGFYGVDIVVFRNESNVQELWVIDVNPYYTDLLSFNDWKMFCSKRCNCCSSPKVRNYAVCSGKLYISGLSKYCGDQLISFCGTQDIYYDHKRKSGCMLYPLDAKNRAIFLFSLNSNRKLAIKKFIEALKTLCKLSLQKPTDKLKTNMHQLAKELEKII